MIEFRDCNGQKWHARVTIGTLRDLEQAVGFPLLEAITDAAVLRSKILGSAEVVGKGLYFACREDANERKVSYGEFEKLISGPAVSEAISAFVASLAECFPMAEASNDAARPTRRSRGHGVVFMLWRRLLAWSSRGTIRSES
jgi:hypothetical protein